MTESITSSSSASNQTYADLRFAFNAYSKNSSQVSTEDSEESKVYKNRGQITRKALADIQSAFPRNIEVDSESEAEIVKETQAQVQSIQTQAPNTPENNNVEIKPFTLPKNTETIISELKRNGLHRTITPYQIANEYGVSYMKAREILDKLNENSNGFVREYQLPQYSTISYKV